MKEVSDSLAGRCAVLTLPPLTPREILSGGWEARDARAHADLLIRGGFPELWADPAIPARQLYQSYVATYLERDLRELIRMGSLRDFERFLRACAARSGGVLNKSELARDVGSSQPTANEWISALEADFLIQGPWHCVHILDAKWSETPREDAFSTLERVAARVEQAQGVSATEVALVSRSATSHRLGPRRHLVSTREIDAHLADSDSGAHA